MSRVTLSGDEQRAVHLARMQYEESAARYTRDGNGVTATEHYKLAFTLAALLARIGYYTTPPGGAA
jgi:hypothetical protein